MANFLDLLNNINDEETEKTVVPFAAPQATMPDNLAQAAQEEAIEMEPAPVVEAIPPQQGLNIPLTGFTQGHSPTKSSETSTKITTTGTIPQSDKADGSETAEARLERLMRELNEQRNKEREDAESRKFKADIAKAFTDNIGTFVSGMQAKNTKAAVNPVQTKGYDVGDLVGQVDKKFSGDREALLDQYKQLLNARDRSEQRKFQRDSLEIQREGNAIKKLLAEKKVENSLSEGEKAADRAFGKDDPTWNSTGKAKVEANLKKLEEAFNKLSSGEFTKSGNIQGRLPDIFQPEEAKAMRDLVRGTAQETLRQTLGSQFTEKEGEAIMNRAYDPTLSPAENAKRVKAVLDELRQGYDARNAQSKYFRGNRGSLKGMGAVGNVPAQSTPPDVDAKIDSFMQKNGIVDRDEAIQILKDAGKI